MLSLLPTQCFVQSSSSSPSLDLFFSTKAWQFWLMRPCWLCFCLSEWQSREKKQRNSSNKRSKWQCQPESQVHYAHLLNVMLFSFPVKENAQIRALLLVYKQSVAQVSLWRLLGHSVGKEKHKPQWSPGIKASTVLFFLVGDCGNGFQMIYLVFWYCPSGSCRWVKAQWLPYTILTYSTTAE